MKYNVLWFEDQYEDLDAINMTAIDFGVKLVPFKSYEGGMKELRRNSFQYDAVLLDAKFLLSEDDEKGTEDYRGLNKVLRELGSLPKQFEPFILTGQEEMKNNPVVEGMEARLYYKGFKGVEEQLFTDLVESAKKQPDTQLRLEHKVVFDVCTDEYIGGTAGQDILAALKSNGNGAEQLNSLRKVVEDVFKAMNKKGLLPDEFVEPHLLLNPTCRFLSGKPCDIDRIGKSFLMDRNHAIPSIRQSQLWNILKMVQDGSHRGEVDKEARKASSSYLVSSTRDQLFDFLIWFKDHVDSDPPMAMWTETVSKSSSGSDHKPARR